MIMKIGETSKLYDRLMEGWKLPLALMEGLQAMRNPEWLPQYSRENDKSYKRRLSVANLYNVFRKTVRGLSGKPFVKSIVVDDLHPDLSTITTDMDRDGLTIEQFARELTSNLLTTGVSYILVDQPYFDSSRLSLAEQRELNIHPYFINVRADNLIYWSFMKGVTGEMVLQEIHIRSESVDDENDEWCWVHRWTRDTIQHWRRKKSDGNDKMESVLDVPNTLGYIPLFEVYADVSRNGRMEADSPLDDLAQLNLRHFQSQSDQDTCLHFARVPFLHFAGFQDSEVTGTVAVNNAFRSTNSQSKIEWIETTGSSLAAGQKDLEALEARMESMGADLLTRRPGNVTATETAIETAEKISDLGAIVKAVESALSDAFTAAYDWQNLTYSTKPKFTIHRGFEITSTQKSSLDLLLKARAAGEISRETWLNQVHRLGVAEFDLDEELNRLSLTDSPISAGGDNG